MNTPAAAAILDRIAPPPGVTSFFQVGYVVPRLQEAIDFFTDRLGMQAFLVLADAQLSDQLYLGKPFSPRQDLAFTYAGNLQIELIQPLQGGDESCYTTFLDRNPAGGLHHLGARVDDLDEGIRQIGINADEVIQRARSGEATRFAYLDAIGPTGSLLELIELDAATMGMFEQLRRGELP